MSEPKSIDIPVTIQEEPEKKEPEISNDNQQYKDVNSKSGIISSLSKMFCISSCCSTQTQITVKTPKNS